MAQIGPKLPPGFKPRQEDDSESDRDSSSSSESEDEFIGPKPVAPDEAGSSAAVTAAEAIERRQLAMRKKIEDDLTDKPQAREEWMLELPDEKRGLLGLGPRKFKTKNIVEKGDRSSWTDTPADKARKAIEDETGPPKPKPMNPEELAAAARDRKLEKIAEKLKAGRTESLLELHRKGVADPNPKTDEEGETKKRKRDSSSDSSSSSSSESESEDEASKKKKRKKRKKEKKKLKKLKKALAKEAASKDAKKKEKKKKKKEAEKAKKLERVPFDREKDLKIVNIDVAARESMIKKATKLNSNFYTGKQKFL